MEMKKYKLGEIAEIVNGATPSTLEADNYDGDIVWITPKDLSNSKEKFIERGERNITQKGFDSCSTHMIPENNILMSSRAPIGLLAINKVPCCTNQGFKNLIVNQKYADVEYLFYYLKFHINEIEQLGSGTTFKEVSKNTLQLLEVSLPPLATQQKIATVLSSLDKKISLNRKINDNLEAMAKQLYDYYFVQFDFPNEQGKPYKTSGGAMVWNEKLKREIPAGWEVKSVNEISTNARGVAYTKDDLVEKDNGILVLRGNNIQDNKLIYDSNVAYVPKSFVNAEQCIKKHDIIVTMSSGSKEHIGKSAMFYKDSDNETFGAFLSKFTPNVNCDFVLHQIFVSEYFKTKIKLIANGTGINNLTNQTFDEIFIAMPDISSLNKFNILMKPIYENIGNLTQQSQALTAQRDALLPLLMNGQVSVE